MEWVLIVWRWYLPSNDSGASCKSIHWDIIIGLSLNKATIPPIITYHEKQETLKTSTSNLYWSFDMELSQVIMGVPPIILLLKSPAIGFLPRNWSIFLGSRDFHSMTPTIVPKEFIKAVRCLQAVKIVKHPRKNTEKQNGTLISIKICHLENFKIYLKKKTKSLKCGKFHGPTNRPFFLALFSQSRLS